VRNLLNLIEHQHRAPLAGLGRLQTRSLPLLLDPVPTAQRRFIGAREAGTIMPSLDDLANEGRLADLPRTDDRLDEAARLAQPPADDAGASHIAPADFCSPSRDNHPERLHAILECDVSAALEKVAVPVLCLTARHDRLMPNAATHLIHQLAPTATIAEINAPHFFLQCASRAAADAVGNFLHPNSVGRLA
jgi:pimeloyl-ACP methyl ester carboxylesterase